MKAISIVLLMGTCLFRCAIVYSASVESQIASNLGNVYLNGLPKLAFDLVDLPDLARAGIQLRMEHHVMLIHGGKARTRWDMASLRSCIYPENESSLIWVKPGGQIEKIRKTKNGFVKRRDRLQISEAGDVIEIRSPQGMTWTYRKGALESISDPRFGGLHFTTDRETILKISRVSRESLREVLLEVIYSKQGEIEALMLQNNHYCKFMWSPDHLLMGVENSQNKRITFAYDKGLLSSWRANDGGADFYKWAERENSGWVVAQGWPPVTLLEDSQYKYRLSRSGNINFLLIHTRDNQFFSETRFNSKGIEQRTPKGKIKSNLNGLKHDAHDDEGAGNKR